MEERQIQPVTRTQSSEPHGLGQFVEDNHRLLTVLGVFTAMTVFSASLSIRGLGTILAFLFMALSILVWFELWSRFPSGTGHWRLTLFENLLSITVFILIFYWLVDFRAIWRYGLAMLLWMLLLSGASAVLKHYDLSNRLFRTQPGHRVILRRVFGIVLIAVTYFSSFYLARVVSPPINRILDAASLELSNPPELDSSLRTSRSSQASHPALPEGTPHLLFQRTHNECIN